MTIAILGVIFGQTKKTAPPPRRARAAFPSPWERGVNGLANYGL